MRKKKGFKLKNSKVGMVFIPIDDNKEDEEAEDDDYTDEEFYKVKRIRKCCNTSSI